MTDQSSKTCGRASRAARLAYRVGTAAALVVWALGSAHAARADTLLTSPTELFTGSSAQGYAVNVPGPGELFVSLSDISYAPGVQGDLTYLLTEGSQVLQSIVNTNAPQTIFSPLFVGSAGTLYAFIAAEATGPVGTGLYSFDVLFRPDPSPVPLPPSVWLLLGGLAAIGGMMRYGMPRLRTFNPVSA